METLTERVDAAKKVVRFDAYAVIGLTQGGSYNEIPEDIGLVVNKIKDGKLQTEVMTLIENQIKKAVEGTLHAVFSDPSTVSPVKAERVLKGFE